MDYSKFVSAIINNDTPEINRCVPIITSVLIKFLKVRLGASHADAEDVAQTTLMNATLKIKNDKIENPDSVIYYLFTTSRNEYYKHLRKVKEDNYEEVPDWYAKEGDQLINILNEERLKILELCMKLLKADFFEYISYWFRNPDNDATVVAEHFGISVNNAWTKKHRIIKILKDCCEKKLAA